MKILARSDFDDFINSLIEASKKEVFGVQSKGDKFVFDPLESADELRLDYDTTILPPKKYFLPQYETLMEFDPSAPFEVAAAEVTKKNIIVGVHPYDIVAFQQMDTYFLDTHVDDAYLKRRKNTLIIGSDILAVSERGFFGDMGTAYVDEGYDLMLTDLGDRIFLDIGTDAGEELLAYANNLEDASDDDIRAVAAHRQKIEDASKRGLQIGPKVWHDLLEKNFDSEVWTEQSDKCLGCGTCTLVCPTCFCYDVADDVSLDMTSGKRVRTWDGCLLRGFTEVAGGEVFRDKKVDRYRHRFNRKGRYLPDRLSFVACVGCGRCASQCIPDIADPVEVFNMLHERATEEPAEADVAPIPETRAEPKEEVEEEEGLHIPREATLTRVEELTENETLFEIEMDDGEPLGHDPGQFVEVSIMGAGEAPISVSSAPGGKRFELVVRNVGDVTSKLHECAVGDKIGIRGPFGTGFDTEALKGKNLLFVAGGLGIVPARSLINHVIDPQYRDAYDNIAILYGCKRPCEMLFGDEVEKWDARDDIEHYRAVDQCPEGVCWDGEVGVVGKLIPKVTIDPEHTVAVVVGPPIMYRFVIKDLLDAGIADENIVVSLERRMKCGVGKCGHCQINGIYVCQEGPVFYYDEIKDLPEAFS